MGWRTRVLFPVGGKKGCFLFATTSRLALGPTQAPIQWAVTKDSFCRDKVARA